MKICGIVAEYNPFHNGHKYQVEMIKKKTNADIIVAVMSGNFVQRGLPASFDKWARTKMAILNGVDIVIELPTLYATSSAEFFAQGAIQILNRLNAIDYISFGVKDDDEILLTKVAEILIQEPENYKSILQKEIDKGVSYPSARSNTLKKVLHDDINKESLDELLKDSNNILAIEYLKALEKSKSNIKPILIKRVGTDYNSLKVSGKYASSTAIREFLNNNDFEKINKVVPKSSYDVMQSEIKCGKLPIIFQDFEKEILYTLRKMNIEDINNLSDVSEGLEFLIKKTLLTSTSLTTLSSNLKSKRYTQTRINRILIHALLDIKSTFLEKYKNVPQYARVLGVSKDGKKALSYIAKKSKIPLVTSVSRFMKEATKKQKDLLKLDILASNIYSLGYADDKNRNMNLDYTKKLIE